MEVAASTAPSPDLAATECSGYNLEESWSRMLGSLPLADSGWLWQTLAGFGRPSLATGWAGFDSRHCCEQG